MNPLAVAWRAVTVAVRTVRAEVAYESASTKPRLSRWLASGAGPNASLGSLAMLRTRSRDLVRNDGYADGAVSGLVSNIVGTGIKPQFRTPDRELNRQLADAWDEWTDESDADGRLDFYGQQALACRAMIEGGDCFGRFRPRRASDGLSVPLQIQLLEGDYCPEWMTQQGETAGSQVISGIEFDRLGRRSNYYFFDTHPGDYWLGSGSSVPLAVPAEQVVHLAHVRRPGMVRGEPWLTRALVKLRELNKYDDAQLVRQQIAALFAGFVEEERPEEGAEGPTFPGQTAADQAGIAIASLEPGTMSVLPVGRSVKFSTPPSPGDSYAEFMKEQRLAIAAAAGVLYETLSGDYGGVNDRTWRAAVSEFRRRCEMWQHHLLVFQFCRPILVRWVAFAVLAGRVVLPAGVSERMVARARWIPVPWPYINPVQDIEAKKLEMRSGLASRSQKVSELGYDVAELDREIADDNARADDFELIFDSDPRRTANNGAEQAPANEAGDDGSPGDGRQQQEGIQP